MGILDILVVYQQAFLSGLLVTAKLSLIIWVVGLVFGSGLGAAAAKWRSGIGTPSRYLSFLLSGIPILVLLFWAHYPLQTMVNVVIDPFWTAAVVLSAANTVAVADLVRNVLIEFPAQYTVAAMVCGVSSRDTLLRIQFPIILRQVIPSLLMLQVYMLQATIFASLISVDEIFRAAQRINAQVYRPVEIYTALAVFFLIICLPLNGIALWMKHQFTRNISEN